LHFRNILIANRGEIALRVMRTCRAMGISTVAVYSDADVRAPHVRFADQAVHIGPPPSKDSYLRIDGIIAAAKRTGVEAIHPGYGFLSENAAFAEACQAEGITFIGPTADVIRKMGLKTIARQMMAEAAVPTVPGYDGEDQSIETLTRKAEAIGLPVLIKASAGGGGKGMRVVRQAGELRESVESARREAEKAFGDRTLLLEKYIDRARHIEVQILGDNHGNVVHLFERECSIQRRYQKIIEESPSPAVSRGVRQHICESAVAAGRAIGYTNAGTVEFILAPSGEFYFIEVNTRLQVEHPVTEMVTGLDLVKLQIEIAEGRAFSLTQEDIKQSGHAIEARLYAEDPDNNFLPAIGKIHGFSGPSTNVGLRLDSGVDRGTEVGIHYDPLLAKMTAHAADRETARRKLAAGLTGLIVLGVKTNREFLIQTLEHRDFAAADYHTGFVDAHLDQLVVPKNRADDLIVAGVVALYLEKKQHADSPILPHLPPNYRNNPFRDPAVKLQVGEESFEISLRTVGGSRLENHALVISNNDWQANVQVVSFEPGSICVEMDGVQRTFRIAQAGDQFFVQSLLSSRAVSKAPRHPRSHAASGHESAYAPMPGQVLKVLVSVGEQVSAGDPLVILEAMKMEQTLRASAAGVVEAVLVKQGDVVAPGDTLVRITAAASEANT
ncbi:MAG TPA: acetyl-CoA carboxylase biotin carboxylase subunit, partial [Blastocatellia bacterium]|nr:acetyl-CoA carboxylase biotin carboxylase subunit [Blastocatellia bacterium]